MPLTRRFPPADDSAFHSAGMSVGEWNLLIAVIGLIAAATVVGMLYLHPGVGAVPLVVVAVGAVVLWLSRPEAYTPDNIPARVLPKTTSRG